MTNWDKRFFELAKHIATWSKDPSTKVGAVIVDNNKRIISTGYNGYPRTLKDEYKDRDEKIAYTIHAENNAILFSNIRLDSTTIYSTHLPCTHCSSLILQVGITKVVTTLPSEDFATRWNTDGITMLKNNGLEIIIL